MKKVLLRAPLLTMSGYGVHARQIYRWLKTKNVKIHVEALSWGVTPFFVDRAKFGGMIGDIMQNTGPKPKDLDVSIQLQLPNEWDPSLAKTNIGVTAGVETTKCSSKWIDAINNMDMVIVPSEHVKNTFLNSGLVMKPIHVIPEAFIDEVTEEHSQLDLDLSTNFNFLVFGQLTGNNNHTDRKNTYNTVKWILESFKKDSDVGIILKTNSGRNTSFDYKRTKKIISESISGLCQDGGPKVYLLHGEMSNKEVASLYREPKVKALVTMTRGEGYGLPILEAAASGLPVIATGWSGHMDFLSEGKFIELPFVLKDVHDSKMDGNIFVPGAKWADVNEKAAKNALVKFREMPEKPKEWAEALALKVREKYSQESINKIYDTILFEVV